MSVQEHVIGNWNQFKGKVKEQWSELTDDELQRVEGDFDQLVGLIQKKTGQAKKKIETMLNEIDEKAGGMFTQAVDTARQYVGQAGGAVRDAADQVRQRAADGYSDAQGVVRDRPTESVAVAFGIGLLVGVVAGLLIRSKS